MRSHRAKEIDVQQHYRTNLCRVMRKLDALNQNY